MTRRHWFVVLLMMTAVPARSQTGEWRDPSPHKVTLVEVEDGVKLEVLDWGGTGRPLLLLAGLGDSAHLFDDMAPTLAKRYRVVGVSRRGFAGSSSPTSGYTSSRLAEDDARVMEALKLQRAVVVGHSYAGEEMHVLGARYADRIGGLVYVDAAFNRGDHFEPYETDLRALPPAPRPQPADLVSFTALRAFLERNYRGSWPEARLRARYVATADGSVRPWLPEAHVIQAYQAESRTMTASYSPDKIRVPALAIFASPQSANELMMRWYSPEDLALRERVEALFPLERENVARHTRWFRTLAPSGRTVEMSGGHDLIVSNPGEVQRQIEEFVAGI